MQKIKFLTLHHKKNKIKNKKRERGEKTNLQLQSNFRNINSKAPEKLSLVTLVTNYHKLSLLSLVVRPWQKFEKHKLVLSFESWYCYFK